MYLLKTFFLWLFSLLFTCGVCAQDEKVRNIPGYETQRIHFGFALGYAAPYFKIERDTDSGTLDSVYNVGLKSGPGFLVGIIYNQRLSNYFDVQFVPTLTFAERSLVYTMNPAHTNSSITKKIESTFLDFPLMLKYKFKRKNNYRFYAVAGGKYAVDLVSQADVLNPVRQLVRLKPYDYGYEIGCGVDCYLRYFKFALEVKVYNGINNLLVKDELIYSRTINSLHSRIVYISLLFE